MATLKNASSCLVFNGSFLENDVVDIPYDVSKMAYEITEVSVPMPSETKRAWY